MGGTNLDVIYKIVGHNESLIIVGRTSSPNFPVSVGLKNCTPPLDAFLVIYHIKSGSLAYSTCVGKFEITHYFIFIDWQWKGGEQADLFSDEFIIGDELWTTGDSYSNDFETTLDALQPSKTTTNTNECDKVICKFKIHSSNFKNLNHFRI